MSTYQSSEEYRAFWADVDEAVEKVAKWPAWMIDQVEAAKFAKGGNGKAGGSEDPLVGDDSGRSPVEVMVATE